IPFKFGTIYNTKTSLKKFIMDYSASLTENFHNIKGKEEWSVKIYCNRKVLNKQIDELSEDAAELEKQIMASSPGKAYILSRKKTDMVENEMDRLCNNYGQEYYNKFESLSELTSRNNLLPKEITGKDHSMILNATFLVSKTKASEFVLTVDSLTKESINNGFIIEATGPWPPFSFISIKEKL
ncbi:MAG: GvpL/GvpF family gas vesicle protein, partial [Bacteroidetes bacterium]|nr:GvpL/GvpF family gas vesicle protein [Bacteroidota bacterium]